MKPRLGMIYRGCAALFLGAVSSTLLAHMEPRLTPTPTGFDSNASPLSRDDLSFMRNAEWAAQKEINVSKTVMDQLSNPQVKSFAQQTIVHHTLAVSDLAALEKMKGVEISPRDESTVSDTWSKRSSDVDRRYVAEMVADHSNAVALFEGAAKSGDSDIASFALKMLPSLQRQLATAHDLQKSLDLTAGPYG